MSYLTTRLIDKFCSVHSNRYDYSRVHYYDAQTKVIIICPDHGAFKQLPKEHLQIGCPICKNTKHKFNSRFTSFLFDAVSVHYDTFDYSHVVFSDLDTDILVTCKAHGHFTVNPKSHLDGEGCPTCKKLAYKWYSLDDYVITRNHKIELKPVLNYAILTAPSFKFKDVIRHLKFKSEVKVIIRVNNPAQKSEPKYEPKRVEYILSDAALQKTERLSFYHSVPDTIEIERIRSKFRQKFKRGPLFYENVILSQIDFMEDVVSILIDSEDLEKDYVQLNFYNADHECDMEQYEQHVTDTLRVEDIMESQSPNHKLAT